MRTRGIRDYIVSGVRRVTSLFRATPEPAAEVEVLVVAEPTQDDQDQHEITARKVIAAYASYMFAKENRAQIFLVSLITLLGTGMNFLAPYLLGEVVKSLGKEHADAAAEIAGEELWKIGGLLAVYTLSQLLPNIRDQLLVPVTAYNTKKILTNITTQQLNDKSLQYHIKTPQSDKLFVMQKSFTVANMGTPLLTQVAPTMLEMMIAVAILTRQYGAAMGAGTSTLFALYTTYCVLTTQPIIHARDDFRIKSNKVWDVVCPALDHYKTIHDFNKFARTIAEVEAAMTHAQRSEVRANSMPLRVGLGQIAIPRIGMLFAMLYVAMRVQSQQVTISEFVTLFGYLNQLSGMIPTVGQAMNQVFAAYPDMKFVFGELGKPAEVNDAYADTPLIMHGLPRIEFNDVTFGYPGRPLSLINLSLTIEPGQTVALVSESGAGKSTLFNLLYGYYQPNSGSITIDGQNIAAVSRQSLQEQIAMVGQAPNLYNGTVRDNIKYGASDPDAVDDALVMQHAQQLQLTDFIHSLDNQLDTDVGQEGKAFSGGQQQKMALLRGFLKKAPIRLLDEVTAALDAGSAEAVLNGIKQHFLPNATSLIITHKLKEITFVDKIVVLDQGKVIAEGTHEVLLKSCPYYLTLWQKQFDSYAEETTPILGRISPK